MSEHDKVELVMIPFPIMSHLVPAIEMAKLLIDRDQRLSITFLIMMLPIDAKIGPYTKNITPHPRINLVHLPENESNIQELMKSPKNFVVRFIESHRDQVKDEVAKIIESKPSNRLGGVVVDMFCTTMIDVASEFRVPSYVFFTCSSAALGLMFHLQSLNDDQNQDISKYEDSDVEILVPTYVNPVPARVLPSVLFDKENSPSLFINIARRFRGAKGILINTFLELERHAIRYLSADEKIPPVYPIGPILHAKGEELSDQNDKIIEWLSDQPDSSVVFLCFGSNGSFEDDQVHEIALALEHSESRFLWSLRKPPPKGKLEFSGEYESFEALLPEGFLQRTSGFGKVIGWAPQMAVLSHPAVGGFVSHCGWNSTLESVWCGVRMAVWPLGAEQQANAFQLVKELEIGVEIKMDYKKGSNVMIVAETIEKTIRQLMNPRNETRVKVKVLKEKIKMVMMEGGSSNNFLGRLIENIMDEI